MMRGEHKMTFQTRQFGNIEFNLEKGIVFPEGIPGFEMLKKFIIIEDQDTNSPFRYLQSIEDGDITFVLTNPHELFPSYAPKIPEIYFEKIGGGDTEDFMLLAIVAIPQEVKEATVNLQAPILFQVNTRQAIQVILEDKTYQTRHKLLDLMGNAGEEIC